jgi:hypothetical protein
MTRLIRALAPVLLLAACANPLGGSKEDASAARQKWDRQGIDDYRYVYSALCYCPRQGPVQVTVHDGQITSVESADPAAGIVSGDEQLVVVTVDELFDRIEEAEETGTFTDVEYHPQLGYPTSAEIGTTANDAGVRYVISDLVPLR